MLIPVKGFKRAVDYQNGYGKYHGNSKLAIEIDAPGDHHTVLISWLDDAGLMYNEGTRWLL